MLKLSDSGCSVNWAPMPGVMVGGVAFACLGATLVVTTMRESEDAKLLDPEAIPAVALVEEIKLAPNGVTPRLVYRLTPAGGRSLAMPK